MTGVLEDKFGTLIEARASRCGIGLGVTRLEGKPWCLRAGCIIHHAAGFCEEVEGQLVLLGGAGHGKRRRSVMLRSMMAWDSLLVSVQALSP